MERKFDINQSGKARNTATKRRHRRPTAFKHTLPRILMQIFHLKSITMQKNKVLSAPPRYSVAFTAPPSSSRFCPTMNPACCEHRKAQAAPNSCGVP